MGKVYEAIKKAESEQPPMAGVFAGTVHSNGHPTDDGMLEQDEFDFVHYSLNTPSASELENLQREREATALLRQSLTEPASEATIDLMRMDPHLAAFYDYDRRAVEQYNKLAIALISGAALRPIKRVLIASAQHGEGRTLVTLNLACALAQAKQRVLVVDTDFHRPSVLRLLGIETELGIAEAIARNLRPGAAAIRVLPYDFVVLPTRERVETPAELLASNALREMLYAFSLDYDFILLDSPPLLTTADSNLLLRLADATLMVVRAGKNTSAQMGKAISPLTEESLFGVVLNRATR